MAKLGPSKHTKGERIIKMWLARNGYRFELHPLVMPKRRADFIVNGVYVFVDGRFWHDPEHTTKSMSKFWRDKVARNFIRDRETERYLRKHGKKFVRIWDSDIKNPDRYRKKLSRALGPAKSTDDKPQSLPSAS